jgi:3-dehydroquinate synthase
LRQLGAVYDDLAAGGHERGEPIIALGGGVVGDLAGLAAATWLRGVPLVQCPTTLEADIDASIGGKTAINHAGGKNLIGAFHQPAMVCIDPQCLDTLPRRDFVAGLAESVKHAVIADADFLAWHEEHADAILDRKPAILTELILRNCRIKAAVVVEDERESGVGGVGRAALNFGHTAGHALESLSEFDHRHGEAVALGMVVALDLAVGLAGFPGSSRDRIESLLQRLGLPTRLARLPPTHEVAALMQRDKKSRRRTVRFVLPERIGSVRWCDAAPASAVEAALRRLQAD